MTKTNPKKGKNVPKTNWKARYDAQKPIEVGDKIRIMDTVANNYLEETSADIGDILTVSKVTEQNNGNHWYFTIEDTGFLYLNEIEKVIE